MTSPVLQNRTFDQLALGDTASLTRTVTEDGMKAFNGMPREVHPAHPDAASAAGGTSGDGAWGDSIAHGIWTGALVSTLIDTTLPGPGTLYLSQNFQFHRPVTAGDRVSASVTVAEKHPGGRLLLDARCINQRGEEVLTGTATVIAPSEPLRLPLTSVPEAPMRPHARYERFVAEARDLPVLVVGVVHPCSAEAIQAAVEARDEGLIEPVLIGPERKIRDAAEAGGVSLAGLRIEDVEHSHAAAARAVELAAGGKLSALMKGSLHTDELLGAVLAQGSGLRTERRISHVYALDVPTYPKPLVVTDAAINIAPTLAQKRDICQNAIDLLHRLGIAEPLVAVLAAVETVNPDMPATLDAAALSMMARRGQITGAKVDGPLAFDNAVSFDAARIKEIVSPVAGQADVLLVPNLEAGNLLAKQFIFLAGADAAGLVLGARVPIILTSRADSLRVRLASVALAKLSVAGAARTAVPV